MNTTLTVAALIVGVVSVVVTWVVYRRSRQHKELTYEVFPALELLTVRERIRERVEVRVDGEIVEGLEGVAIDFRSSGTLAVEYPRTGAGAGALDSPVTVDFGHGARIIGTPTVKTVPDGLRVDVAVGPEDASKIVLERFLLNPGESARVTTTLTNFRGRATVSGHIKDLGLREYDRERHEIIRALRTMGLMLVASGALTLLFLVGISLLEGDPVMPVLRYAIPAVGFVVIFMMGVFVIISRVVIRSLPFRRT